MIGQTVGHYKIVAKLGEGGMGEVYLAEDTQLKRKIALKVLPSEMASDPERLARFKREAETVAALNHPNIVTIFSVERDGGTHFLTMEWVDGKTLGELMAQGPMQLERVFEIVTPLADALASAHEQGITHRDLKPANIMVTDRGLVKILDFGLAKLHEGGFETDSGTQPTQALTQEGFAVGTVPYMSPEQVRGEPVDSRSDIFSLGIILYEMVAGRRPFEGKSSADLVSSILRDKPPSVTDFNAGLPHHLGRVIHRCMEKDSEKRYQSAKDVRNELEGLKDEVESGVARLSNTSTPAAQPVQEKPKWLVPVVAGVAISIVLALVWMLRGGDESEAPSAATVAEATGGSAAPAATSDRDMVIVLPFENLGPAEDEYFAAGIADEINGRLASVSGLGVISRKTAGRYAGTEKSVTQIGAELNVDYVLGGTVRWARQGDGSSRVRISPELIRVENDTQIWTQIYDREINDIFEVQSEIATQVIQALDLTLLGSEKEAIEARPTENVEAYQAYLQAENYERAQKSFAEQDEEVIALYEKAVEFDPGFLEAWRSLSYHHSLAYTNLDRTEERLGRAKAALDRAAELDAEAPGVHLARGYYHYYGFRDYDRALEEFEAAAAELPNDSETQQAIAFIHRRKGDLEASIEGLERAAELDPQDFNIFAQLAVTYRAQRDTENTLRNSDRAIILSPQDDSLYAAKVDAIVELTGDLAAARRILDQLPRSNPWGAFFAELSVLFPERNWVEIIRQAELLPVDLPIFGAFKTGITAIAKAQRDGIETARSEFEAAVDALKTILEQSPGNADLHKFLSMIYAQLGEENAAIREAKLAVDLTSKDAFSGPDSVEQLARTYAALRRADEALEIIERLLTSNYSGALTVHELRLDPSWDPIRDEPRFQAMLEKHEKKRG